jgi:TRAP transporter 4TM/12TM fusion protein
MVVLAVTYVTVLVIAARRSEIDFSKFDMEHQPEAWPTIRGGLDFLIPIGVLVWCLMIEQLSPALSAFYGVSTLLVMLVTRPAIVAMAHGRPDIGAAWWAGLVNLYQGLAYGARNMISIAVATATAGVIVGSITLTGVGLMMTEFVEFVSGGNLVVMLLFTALVCLVLGLGVPTTANYILVATLMAPVIVELAAQGGLAVPLIAVHLFVFYFGIMGDITPPVGLATFAAAAISGEDPIKTGIQGAIYASRTVILPFIFIFNPTLLLIGVTTWTGVVLVAVSATVAALLFASVTMGWMRVRLRIWEWAVLFVAMVVLFRPDAVWDTLFDPYEHRPAGEVFAAAATVPPGQRLVLHLTGITLEGRDVDKVVAVPLGDAPEGVTDPVAIGRARLQAVGLQLMALGDQVQVANVQFGSRARRLGIEQGFDVTEVLTPAPRPPMYWMYLPAFLLAGLVWWRQGRRLAAPDRNRF